MKSRKPMPGGLPRREVLRGGLVSVAAALGHLPGCAAGPPAEEPFTPPGAGGIPRRILGNTGIEIPLVGLGTAILSGGIGTTMDDQELESTAAIVSRALDLGMNYIDTASAYGEVQRAVGLALQGRREDAFLVTKLWADSAEQAEAQLSSSLADLGTDFVDLLYLHDLGERNLDLALGPGGAWEFILQQKAAGVARLVGATGHHLPERMTDFIGRGEADVVMTPINYVDVHTYNFEQAALQPAREQGMGFLAMKVFGGAAGGFEHADDTLGRASELEVSFDHTALQDAIRYARSLDGVSGMVIGVGSMEELEEVAAWAAESSPLSAQEVEALRSLGATVAEAWAGRFG